MTRSPIRSDPLLVPQLPDNTSVKLIGLGGVGGIVARYLSIFLASFHRPARLVLIDGDSFEPSNATRMFFLNHGNKARVTREEIIGRFEDSSLALIAIEEYVTPENIARLLHNDDIVILAVDNHATRKFVNDFCATKLTDVCLISGGNDGVEKQQSGTVTRGTYGNCQIYIRRNGEDCSPSLVRYHPEIANPADHLPTDKSCTDLVASVPQILFTNLMTASTILNAFWLYLSDALHYSELCFDIADGLMRTTPIPAPNLLTVISPKSPAPAHRSARQTL